MSFLLCTPLIRHSSLILSKKLCRDCIPPTLSTQSHCSHYCLLLAMLMRSCTSCSTRITKHHQEDWISFQYCCPSSNTVSVSSLLLCVEQEEEKMQKIPPSCFTKGLKYELVLPHQKAAAPIVPVSELIRTLWRWKLRQITYRENYFLSCVAPTFHPILGENIPGIS